MTPAFLNDDMALTVQGVVRLHLEARSMRGTRWVKDAGTCTIESVGVMKAMDAVLHD